MSDLFNIGQSGIVAARTALTVTGENIANADTEGYRRRDVAQQEIVGAGASLLFTDAGPQGVEITDIRRAFDSLIAARTRMATASHAAAEAFLPHLELVEDTMIPRNGGSVTDLMADFFGSLANMSGSPADSGLRRVVLETGSTLAAGISEMTYAIERIRDGVQDEAQRRVDDVNTQLIALGELQKDITSVTGTARAALLDRRDVLLNQLASNMDIHVAVGARDSILVSAGTVPGGPVLMNNSEVGWISRDPTGRLTIYDPTLPDDDTPPVRMPFDGALKGLNSAIGAIDETIGDLNRWATKFVRQMNELHQQGLDLNGDRGGQIFSLDGWAPTLSPLNRGSALVGVTVTDPEAMPEGPLELVYDNKTAVWLLNTEEGETLASGNPRLGVEGLAIAVSGTVADGDRVTLTRTNGHARNMMFLLDDVTNIAAAGALTVSSSPENAGTARMSASEYTPPVSPFQDLSSVLTGDSTQAVEFLSPGVVGTIPAEAGSASLLALSRDGVLEASLPSGANVSEITLDIDGEAHSFLLPSAMTPEEAAEALRSGAVLSGDDLSFADLGLTASGTDGRFAVAVQEGRSMPSVQVVTDAGSFDAITVVDPAPAAELSVFTREGRQLSGPALSPSEAAALLTPENGFVVGAVYQRVALNEASGYSTLTQDQASGAGAATLWLGEGLEIATWSGSDAAPARASETIGFASGDSTDDITIPVGASAARQAEILADALPLSATAYTAALLDVPATGRIVFDLSGDNTSASRIEVNLDAEGPSGLAAAINSKSPITGIRAERASDGRFVLIHEGGANITLSALNASDGTLGITRLGQDGQTLGAQVLLGAGQTAARITGTVQLSGADDFGVSEGGLTINSIRDPFVNGRLDRTITDAGSTQVLGFHFEAALDGAVTDIDAISAGSVGYRLNIGLPDGTSAEFAYDPSLEGVDATTLAAGLAAAMREEAPASSITGSALASFPPQGAQVKFMLGSQGYAVRMTAAGPEVVGPEPDRLNAYFNDANQLVVETVGGHLDGAPLRIPPDAADAARFGLGVDDLPQTRLTGQPFDAADLPASFVVNAAGTDYTFNASAGGLSAPADFPGSTEYDDVTGAFSITVDARLGEVRVLPGQGAQAAGFKTIGAELAVAGDQLAISTTDGRVLDLTAQTVGSATRIDLDNLPGEDLLVVMTGEGALRLSGEIGAPPEKPRTAVRELRVLDAEQGLVGLFDQETGASIATRTLDAGGTATLGGYAITLESGYATGDTFVISPNGAGSGDARTTELMADLQNPAGSDGRGGFTALYAEMLGAVGSAVRAGEDRRDSTEAVKDSALKAEAEASAVDLDEEAAKLMRHQQSYQASAQIISVARQMFQTLLNSL
ncbi:MAG: flagellar basal body rod C-terminal domain-containing protein [Pseudomonadota bacterium]|nr:flagellar basal body rod C-terminal domain-containing protein [Pseudomonadota bacterium]